MGTSLEFGICTGPPGPDLARALVAAGYSYYEPSVASAIMAEDSGAFSAGIVRWRSGGLPPRGANVLLPASLKVVGEDVDGELLHTYLTEAMRRVGELGIERVVFGSGDARRVPPAFPAAEAARQLGTVLRLAVELAPVGTVVCLENLRRRETNLVNRLSEAAEMVDQLGIEGLALVVDAFHLDEEGEDPAIIAQLAERVAHVHVCGSARMPPGPTDEDRLCRVFAELADIGYEGRCSLECNWDDLAQEAPRALASVRRAATAGGYL